MKTLIIIPTYNELDNLRPLLNEILSYAPETDILIVDDNSPDGTGELADEIHNENPHVHVLHRPGKLGLGTAYITGFKYAVEHNYDVAFEMDADFSHDATIIPHMVRAIADGYGLAIGSRYVKGGGIENWPLKRKVTSLVAIALAKPLTPVRDITSGYFLVRREALDGVDLDPIGFKIGLEVIAKARYGRALEVPYVFTDRVAGESKLNSKEIANYLRQLRRIYGTRLRGRR